MSLVNEQQEAMKVKEVARRLRVNVKTVYRMLETGQLNGVRAGRLWRIPVTSFEEYLHGSRAAGSNANRE